MTSFAEASAVKPLTSHSYAANFYSSWCVGSVPHGGFVTAVFLQVAAAHFRTTLARQNQPHTITLHLEFLRRTQEGPAVFTVQDLKLGRQTSNIHVSLSQGGREAVVGYLTNSNLHAEEGISLETDWSLHPPPPSVDLAKLAQDKDDHWELQKNRPFPKFRKVYGHVRTHLPRRGQAMRSLADEWLRFPNGEKFTNESVGLVADLWPQIVEAYNSTEDQALSWYPTLLLNLDVKKALPAEGVEWLFARVRAKKIKNGRQDLEVVIMDETGDIVALSSQVALILDSSRNTAKRRPNKEVKL
ncbi:thioesterase-like superfamily-domain-containing protein [Phyllosticta citrichinensis]|uniref:Thioesterase-like superfamily-domain-containing protein n=1 Tax=Phyllosticta citrichinensis TaxID=1130410 RepID=A0ABR1Y6Z0_9PEZI